MRIEVLEKQNRRLKQIAAGGLLLVATVAVMGASGVSRTIEAQRFVLTDSTGRTRAALGLDKDTSAPALTLYTENGKLGVRLIVYGGENPFPILEMLDGNIKNTVALDNGGLHLNDPNSSTSVSLTVYDGHPALISRLADMLDAFRKGRTTGYVFQTRLGSPLDLDNLARREIIPILTVNQIAWLGWHAFRRGLATNLHSLGVNDKTIQGILRHTSLATTQAIYIKVIQSDVQAAMNTLASASASAAKPPN